MQIIRTNSLTNFFGTTAAIDNISIPVDQGEIYGFLGLNGAGKTTLSVVEKGPCSSNAGSYYSSYNFIDS